MTKPSTYRKNYDYESKNDCSRNESPKVGALGEWGRGGLSRKSDGGLPKPLYDSVEFSFSFAVNEIIAANSSVFDKF